MKKAHKQLGNYMMRYYNDTTQTKFRIWKEKTIYQGQKTKLMRRTIEHMRKH